MSMKLLYRVIFPLKKRWRKKYQTNNWYLWFQNHEIVIY